MLKKNVYNDHFDTLQSFKSGDQNGTKARFCSVKGTSETQIPAFLYLLRARKYNAVTPSFDPTILPSFYALMHTKLFLIR